jgi:hypothetical protein
MLSGCIERQTRVETTVARSTGRITDSWRQSS